MAAFARRLLEWYEKNKRTLPWRGQSDPYAVWVSEIMLQQTRVGAAAPYYERWMKRFPGIRELAQASEREVLQAWEGLGYYARARNLRRAAQVVMQQYGGRLPQDAEELRRLPGIGRYTAGAIASIAFGRDEPALDGNIRRVLARVFNVATPADSPAGMKELWGLAGRELPRGRAADYNQALMDLGATVCLPAAPRCPVCPVRRLCSARRLGVQEDRPVLRSRASTPHRQMVAAVIIRRGRALLAQRPSNGLLGGLWEFPSARVKGLSTRSAAEAIRLSFGLDISCGMEITVVTHAYSHFRVTVHALRCDAQSIPKATGLRWVPIGKLGEYPMGAVDRRIARTLG